jgi:hypothetical protein
MGAEHGSRWHNTRFYYNPINSLLEPIGFDGDSGQPITELCATKKGIYIGHSSPQIHTDYYAMLFNDPIFFKEYIKTLERISKPSYLNELLAGLNDELEKNLRIIYKEFPGFHFSKNLLYRNQRYIRTVLNPGKGMHAHYHKACKHQIELELGNIQQIPIEALNVSYKDSFLFQPVQSIILPAKMPSNPVDYQHVTFMLPQDFVWEDTMIADLKINYRLLGTSLIRTENIFPWPYLDENFRANDFIRQKPNIHELDFLIISESTETVFIKPGIWNLDQNLIIPKGYKVVCNEGVQLNLSKSAKILSYSPLEFIGSEANPIFIHSGDSTGQGIAVMTANQTSVLEYVIFSNLSNPSQSGWQLTGAITFYESPVDISHCQFVGNRAEDSLNIVRSEFTIDKTIFRNTSFDAFDADFTKGKIISSSFVDCGNDAIDVSGSVIELQNIFINGVGDKGLSIGEKSQVIANQIEIKNAAIALASKDLSQMDIENVNISDAAIGFAAYQKKSEFGPASITAANLTKERITNPYLLEEASILIIDEMAIESNNKNINELLYGSESGQNNN